jgi:hypothetical protein
LTLETFVADVGVFLVTVDDGDELEIGDFFAVVNGFFAPTALAGDFNWKNEMLSLNLKSQIAQLTSLTAEVLNDEALVTGRGDFVELALVDKSDRFSVFSFNGDVAAAVARDEVIGFVGAGFAAVVAGFGFAARLVVGFGAALRENFLCFN